MREMSIISSLHQKFAERTWNDTFQLVRRCMERSRDKSKPCELLVRSMKRLQEELDVSSVSVMRTRLEMMAKQQGMGFHVTDATCYLTADLFYLEVVLEPCGGVEEVKVAPQGGPPVSSEAFLQLLRSKKFADFSVKLACLFTQYNIPGDNEIKLKLFTSLQYLGKDLQQISHLPRVPKDSDSQMDMINNGRVGCLIAGKEDSPLTIQFYMTPAESVPDTKPAVQTAQVTVGVSDVTHKLQMSSVIQQPPQLDPSGYPVFLPLTEVPHETLPARFLLRLQPALPVMTSFLHKLRQITDVTVADVDLQWAPLPQLLMSSLGETLDERDTIFTMTLPGGVMHSYIFPQAAWEASSLRGTVMDSVPFTHPAHVPAALELLRHHCVINTLLRSCVSSQRATSGSICDLHCEVLPESDTSFSVTFHPPDTDSLALLLVNVSDSHQIECSLFGAGARDPTMDQHISAVMKRCMSVPGTMRALYGKLEEVASAPLSPDRPAAAELSTDRSAPTSTAVPDADSTPAVLPQAAAVAEDAAAAPGSACCAMSVASPERLPEINAGPAAKPYTFSPVGVLSHWMGNNGQLSELT